MNETTHTPGKWTPASILNLAEASEVEFAVRACNAHDDLVAALALVLDYFKAEDPHGSPREEVEAALAKAGEK